MRRSRLLAFMALTIPGFVAAQPSSNQDDVSVRRLLQDFDGGLKDRFVAAFSDLNGDGRPEAIVHLTNNEWCGIGGCATLVLVRDGDSWKVLGKISISRPPIQVLTMKSNGWRSIAVWVQGGGIQPGHEVELRFNGKTYPTNPSVAPARPTVGKPEGEVVIPTSIARQQ
jgi:hypothetical protein